MLKLRRRISLYSEKKNRKNQSVGAAVTPEEKGGQPGHRGYVPRGVNCRRSTGASALYSKEIEPNLSLTSARALPIATASARALAVTVGITSALLLGMAPLFPLRHRTPRLGLKPRTRGLSFNRQVASGGADELVVLCALTNFIELHGIRWHRHPFNMVRWLFEQASFAIDSQQHIKIILWGSAKQE